MGGTQHSKEYCPEPSAGEREKYFQNPQGLWLFHNTYHLEEGKEPKGVVFLCHGYGEHVMRPGYADLAKKFNEHGFIMHALDHQGHGRSNGERAHVVSFNDYVDDFTQFMDLKLKDTPPHLPVFLFAHSMGTLIGIDTCLRMLKSPKADLFKGVVLSGTCLTIDPNLDNSIMRGLSSVVSKVSPKFATPGTQLDLKGLTRNPAAIESYVKDPLVYAGAIRSCQGNEILLAVDRLRAEAKNFTYPVLMVHGSKDSLTLPSGAEFFHANCGSQDKELFFLNEFLHEPFEDHERDVFYDAVVRFYNRRVQELKEKKEEKKEEEEKKEKEEEKKEEKKEEEKEEEKEEKEEEKEEKEEEKAE